MAAEQVHHRSVEREEADDDKAYWRKRQQRRTRKTGDLPPAREHGSSEPEHTGEQKQPAEHERRIHVPSRLTQSKTADGLSYR